jgi:cellulose synthase/poly-beta-1,6-N-acetylglucosamine synthase-like glycosyltransferase
MAFRSEIPERYGWPAHSIVEDLEFTLRLVEDRILVHYLPNAVVLGEMARTAAQATPQRERWEGGRVALLKAYAPGLVRAWFRRPRMALVDAFMDLVIPPLTLLVGMQVFSACLLACFHPVGWGLLAVFAVIDLFYVLSGLWLRHVPCRVWMALVAAPVFVLWKVPVYVRMLIRGGPARWVRTPRRGEEEPGSR